MADENTLTPMPQHLDEIAGTPKERTTQKIAIIRDHGYEKWAELVRRSAKDVVRTK